jgi:hypothetical protein
VLTPLSTLPVENDVCNWLPLPIWPDLLALRRLLAPFLPLIIFPQFHIVAIDAHQKRTETKRVDADEVFLNFQ